MKKYFYLGKFLLFMIAAQNLLLFEGLLGSNENRLIKLSKSNIANNQLTKKNNETFNDKQIKITFSNIEDILLKNNLEIKKANQLIEEAALNLKSVKSKYNLTLDLDGSIPQYNSGKVYDRTQNLETSQNISSATIGVTLPLFNPVKKPEIESAKKRFEVAQNNYEIKKKDILLEAMRRLISFNSSYQEVKNGNQSVTLSLLGLKDAEAKYENGIGNKLDLLEAKIQLKKDQQFLIDKQNEFKLASNSLKKILYLDNNSSLKITSEQEVLGWWDYSLDENIKLGKENSLNLRNAKVRELIKLDESKIAIGRSRPSFFIKNESTASFSKGESLVEEVNEDAYQNSYINSVSLNFQWDVFDGGVSKNESKLRKLQANVENLNYEIQSNLLEEEIIRRYKILKADEKKIIISKEELNSAQEAMELSRLRLENGVSAQRELINSQKDLTTAKSAFSRNIANYNSSLMTLIRFTGLQISGLCENATLKSKENRVCFLDKSKNKVIY